MIALFSVGLNLKKLICQKTAFVLTAKLLLHQLIFGRIDQLTIT
jgi:hypothetical protein